MGTVHEDWFTHSTENKGASEGAEGSDLREIAKVCWVLVFGVRNEEKKEKTPFLSWPTWHTVGHWRRRCSTHPLFLAPFSPFSEQREGNEQIRASHVTIHIQRTKSSFLLFLSYGMTFFVVLTITSVTRSTWRPGPGVDRSTPVQKHVQASAHHQ